MAPKYSNQPAEPKINLGQDELPEDELDASLDEEEDDQQHLPGAAGGPPILEIDLVWQLEYNHRQLDDLLSQCETLKEEMVAEIDDISPPGNGPPPADIEYRETRMENLLANQTLFDLLFPTCQQLQQTIASYLRALEARVEE